MKNDPHIKYVNAHMEVTPMVRILAELPSRRHIAWWEIPHGLKEIRFLKHDVFGNKKKRLLMRKNTYLNEILLFWENYDSETWYFQGDSLFLHKLKTDDIIIPCILHGFSYPDWRAKIGERDFRCSDDRRYYNKILQIFHK